MKRIFLSLPVLVFLLGCPAAREAPLDPAAPEEPERSSPVYGRRPMALLQDGENPLWFELGEQGPALIPGPEEAPLRPFAPWPLALRVAGVLALEDRIVLGINREGFLTFEPQTEDEPGIALYRIDNSPYWQDYSVASHFVFDSKAAALLYRDDYFIDHRIPPPSLRVWALDNGAEMQSLSIRAFEDLPPEDGWDLEALRQGPDDRWHYRAVRKSGSLKGVGYFRAGDLAGPGEPSNREALQNAARPRLWDQAPEPLRQVLEATLIPEGESIPAVAQVVSPEFESRRNYAASERLETTQGDMGLYNGYYLKTSGNVFALVVGPEGRGFIGALQKDALMLRKFALPPLPKGFVYTGAALFHRPSAENPSVPGQVSVTALGIWEEQENWNVGAAGFVLSPVYAMPGP
jgi:hypothetical protein